MAVDMYEHSYLLDYGEKKNMYARDIWSNVDWSKIEQRYRSSLATHVDRVIQH